MRLICPHCQKTVALPDGAAGQPTPCPLCGHIFTPPPLTGAALDRPPEPAPAPPAPTPAPPPAPAPILSPPASKPVAGAVVAPTAATAPPDPAAGPCCRLTLRRDVVRWLAPAGLLLAFLLTFMTWVSAAPGGYPVYTQNAWQVAFGDFWTDSAGDEVLKQRSAALDKHTGWAALMVLYVLALVATLAMLVGDLIVGDRFIVPDALRMLQPVWSNRRIAAAALTLILLLVLVIQCLAGFGIERGGRAAADEAVPALQASEGSRPTATQLRARDINYAVELNAYGLRRTWWWTLAFLAQLVAAAGVVLTVWLERRGLNAEPRLECYC